MHGLANLTKGFDMSMKDRLAKKTQDLIMPAKGEAGGIINPIRTGPGQMLMVNSLMKESNEKVAVLEARLREFEGGLPVALLDPSQIVRSRWANRASASFDSAEFQQLKEEIAQSHGNVQPIKVRPLPNQSGQFEIIFGHRRHRACAALHLPVLALIEAVTDAELFKQMDRENRMRADLSPWEQGMMYRLALNDGLFTSREQLARELGIDAGNLSKALRLAELDPAVVSAFGSPLELQYRWAKPLADALQSDRPRVLALAMSLSATAGTLSAKKVFESLTGMGRPVVNSESVRVNKKVVAELQVDGEHVVVRFSRRLLGQEELARLRHFIGTELFGG